MTYPCQAMLIMLSTVVGQTVQDGIYGPLTALALDQRGVGATLSGMIVAAPWLSMTLAASLVAVLLSRCNSSACVAINAIASACLFLCFLISDWPIAWLSIGLIFGVTMAVRWVVGEAWLMQSTPIHIRGKIVGVQEALVGLVGTAGPLVLLLTGVSGVTPFVACAGLLATAAVFALCAGALSSRAGLVKSSSLCDQDGDIATLAIISAAVGGATESAAHSYLPVVLGPEMILNLNPLVAASVFGLGGVAFQIPIGLIIDRRGFGSMFPAASLGGLLASLLLCCVQDPVFVLILLFILGASSSLFYTLATLMVAQKSSSDHLAVGIAKLAVANTLGAALGTFSMGCLVDLVGGKESVGLGVGLDCLAGAAISYSINRFSRPSEIKP